MLCKSEENEMVRILENVNKYTLDSKINMKI